MGGVFKPDLDVVPEIWEGGDSLYLEGSVLRDLGFLG